MSASISCSEALKAIRNGARLSPAAVRALGEEQPRDFFGTIIEALADSFDPVQAIAYEHLMAAWGGAAPHVPPKIPNRVDTVYVLSRVTLGADIKITSTILDAMKHRFPSAEIRFVANRKSMELFAADARIAHHNADYPRAGPVSDRIAFAHTLRNELQGRNRIVVDPDSRITQLGLVPVAEPERSIHFPSRTMNGERNLTQLTQRWLASLFGPSGEAYIAPQPVRIDEAEGPRAAISLGVGGNESKRMGGNFETQLIATLARRFPTLWIDRGAGGEEAQRVTAAAEASGYSSGILFWEGSFAGFASLIAQSDLYVGYDSAGQHAAAAAGTPLISIFAGAPSQRFLQRWAPQGRGIAHVIEAESSHAEECLDSVSTAIDKVLTAIRRQTPTDQASQPGAAPRSAYPRE